MSRIRMSHVMHVNESFHTYEWVMSHIWMSRAAHMHGSCHAYEWVMSRIWMSHVTHMNESCHAYEWVMSHIWTHLSMSCVQNTNDYVKHINESCHIYECVMSRIRTSHVTYVNKSHLSHLTDAVSEPEVSLTARPKIHKYERATNEPQQIHNR